MSVAAEHARIVLVGQDDDDVLRLHEAAMVHGDAGGSNGVR